MTFINEYIPQGDYEKYDLRQVCGEHNLPSRRGHMHSRSWTVDRDVDAFLIEVWAHHESEFSGWAFYWKGVWMFFEMRPVSGRADMATSSCWFLYCVRRLEVPSNQASYRAEILGVLQEAITAMPGGVEVAYAHRFVEVQFLPE